MALEENETQTQAQSKPIGSSSVNQHCETAENIEEQTPENLPNKRRRSVAWDHFDRISVNGKKKAKCKHCFACLVAESKDGTKHLLDHMKSCKAMKQPNIKERYLAGNSKSELSTKVYSEKDRRGALAEMVILHEYPLSIVDHVGFRKFTRTIQPLFKCPTRNTLKSDIIKLFEEQKTHVSKSLENIQSRVAITTDMWTSSNQKKGFMAITCHFIDNEWNLQRKILRFIYVPCPHTSDVLTKVLMGALMEWNLDTKLSTITVDNCTTNDSLMHKIKEKLDSDKLIHDGTHIHMRCCAHILNIIVKIGLSVIKVAIENVRDSVHYWTATPKIEKMPTKSVQDWRSFMMLLLFFWNKFDEYWGTIHELMGVAAVFDPRYKMEMVEIYFPLVYPIDSEAQVQRIRNICDELVKEYQKNNSDDVQIVQDSMGLSSANESAIPNMSAWERHLLTKRRTSQHTRMTELDHYLEEGIEPQANDFDILLWWKLSSKVSYFASH